MYLTFSDLEYIQLAKVACLTARRQCIFAMAEEVFSYLRVAERFHVVICAVHTTTGLVEADNINVFGGVSLGEFPCHVGVEAFGAEGNEHVDC